MNGEYDSEPVPGLPDYLPEGEALLWQGAPSWTAVARYVFHAGAVALYFAALIAWRLGSAYSAGTDVTAAYTSALLVTAVAAAGLGLIALLSWLTSRTTIYSITSRRVVMRYGIAMPMSVNIPYTIIASADLNTHRDGAGDVALTVTGNGKLAYFHLWPHARPWHLTKTQPMLRCLAEPAAVANILSKAMHDAIPESERSLVAAPDAGSASLELGNGHALAATA